MQMRRSIHEQRKRLIDNRFQMFMRVTLQLTESSFGKFEVADSSFAPNYTGNHVAVFECELKAPPQLAMIDHTLSEYMLAHRINFRNWRLVDFDNTMRGNSYFAKQQTIEEFTANVDKLTGTDYRVEVKNRDMPQLKKEIELFMNFYEMKEPASNINMPVFYHK